MNGKRNKGILSVIDVICCIVLALAFTAAPSYINEGICKLSLGYLFSSAAFFIILLFGVLIVRMYLQTHRWNESIHTTKTLQKLDSIFSSKFCIWYSTGIILLCWSIPLVCLYPGTLANDTWGELQQFISFSNGCGGLSDHHPLLDTMLMGSFIVNLSNLTGRWHLVIFMYELLQAFLTSFSFAYAVNYTYKKLQLGTVLTLVLLLIYCFLPIYPSGVQVVSKDSLFSWGFTLFFVYFLEIIRTKGMVCKEKKFLTIFTVLALFCCLTKKVGFYVVLLSLAITVIFLKKNRVFLLIPLFCTVAVMNLAMPAVLTKLQVAPGGKQEMFSLPFQMTARYVKAYGEDILDDEYTVIDKVLTISDLAERYNPTNADPVKDFYQKGTNRDYFNYIGVWARQGIRHPDAYISALNSMLAGWFSWSEYDPLMNMDWRNQLDPEIIPEWAAIRGFSDTTANAYQEMYHSLYRIPFIQIFFSYGFYASLLPAFVVCTVLRKWKYAEIQYWLALLPFLFSLILGCWLAPVSIHFEGRRYLQPIIYTIPLLIMWCIFIYKHNSKE